MKELQQRIDRYLPLNELEQTLKYLFLNNISLNEIDYDSKSFLRNIKPEKNMTQDETLQKFKRFISHLVDNSYLETDMFIPEGRNIYIRKFPRYMIAQNHYHKDAIEINIVLQGEFIQKINGDLLRLKCGDICFVAPNVKHATRAIDDNTVALSIIVYQNVVKEMMPNISSYKNNLQLFLEKILYGSIYHPFLVCGAGHDIDLMGMVMDLEMNQDEKSPFINDYMKTGLELFILRILMKHARNICLGNNIEKNETDILNLLDYIEANYRTITLNALADVYHYSPAYLSALIKNQYGKNFNEIITNVKMANALKLLQETDYSMARIAELVGYSDKSYFLRRFKSIYGMTPSEYKILNR